MKCLATVRDLGGTDERQLQPLYHLRATVS